MCFFRCLLSSYHLSLTFSVLAEELPEANPTPEEVTEDADAEELLVDSDSATDYEESFIIKSKPRKIKVDSRLLSGFCLEAAVPLEKGKAEWKLMVF